MDWRPAEAEEQEFLLQVVEDYRKKIDVTKKSGLSVC
jgi:hypothetical protein